MKNIIKILKYAKKYRWLMAAVVISMIVQTAAALYEPQVLQKFVSLFEIGGQNIKDSAIRLAVILLITYALQAVSTFARSYLAHYSAWNFVHDMRVRLFEHIESLSMQFFHNRQTGELMSRVINDTSHLEVLLAHAVPDTIVNIATFIGALVILLSTNVLLTAAAFMLIPVIAYLIYRFMTQVRPLFKKTHEKNAELSATLQDNFSGIKEIHIFNRQQKEKERVSDISREYVTANIFALKKSALYHPAIGFIMQLGTVMLLALGGSLAAAGKIKLSEVVAFFCYLNMLYNPIHTLGRLSEDWQNSGTAIDRIIKLLSEKSMVEDMENAMILGRVSGSIEYKNVYFRYNKEKEKYVIKNFNLKIKCGEKVALVGETGVGKTTLASLLARFYDPTEGQILIDGVDIKTVTQHSLRENISIVLQDVFLFNGTIADNIAYGVSGATREQIMEAAKTANAHSFIIETEKGYDTVIGERGIRLSGGQKQRLSIARAILKDAPILVLDEATASVDNETEKLIHEAIDRVTRNRTTIIIAHRLSTIKNADKIAVIKDGTIAELGSHEELLKNGRIYPGLYNSAGEIRNIV